MRKVNQQSGYLMLEGVISFFLVTLAIFLYLPLVLNLLERLELERKQVELNRQLYEAAEVSTVSNSPVSRSVMEGMEIYVQTQKEARKIYQIAIEFD